MNTLLEDDATPREQRLWSLRTLLKMGADVDLSTVQSIDDLTVAWGFPVADQVRRAVVAGYGDADAFGTDVRYSIECYLQEPLPDFDVEACKVDVQHALLERGLSCSEWQEVGEYYGQGSGNCYFLRVDDIIIALHKSAPIIGRFNMDGRSEHPKIEARIESILNAKK